MLLYLPLRSIFIRILPVLIRILLELQCDELAEHGASVAQTPAAVVTKCKYTFAMLSDPSAALAVCTFPLRQYFDTSFLLDFTYQYMQTPQVVFGKDGIVEHVSGGKGYIDMSTVDAATSSKISEV